MRTKHIYVPALDVGEFLPFCIRQTHTLSEQIKEQERARKELEKFILILEKHYGEPIWYIGMDIIGEKAYERFIFENGGFFEVMTESPIVLNAHFVHEDKAGSFVDSLKASLREIMPDSNLTELFLSSIKVETEGEMTVHKWHTMKEIRENETNTKR